MLETSKNLESKILTAISKTAILLGELSASSTCTWWFHQPKMPEEMKKRI